MICWAKQWVQKQKKKITVADSYEVLVNEESDKLIDTDQIVNEAKKAVEDNGIVLLMKLTRYVQDQRE